MNDEEAKLTSAPSNWYEFDALGCFLVLRNRNAPEGVKRYLDFRYRPDLTRHQLEKVSL
jgi:hypothetical protein